MQKVNLSGAKIGDGPSNTSPAKCTSRANRQQNQATGIVLCSGVDTLAMNYYGKGHRRALEVLELLKQNALEGKSSAFDFKGRQFEVAPKSAGQNFKYLLKSDDFNLKVSAGRSDTSPKVQVVYKSAFLWSFGGGKGFLQAEQEAFKFVAHFFLHGSVENKQISRVDLCMDVGGMEFSLLDVPNIVKRALYIRNYEGKRVKVDSPDQASWYCSGRDFTGATFGRGQLMARLYEKTIELRGSDKEAQMVRVWGGPQEKVWRLEFQIRREKLKQFQIESLTDLIERGASLWSYLSKDWLTLKAPGRSKQRTRWKTDLRWMRIIAGAESFGSWKKIRVPKESRAKIKALVKQVRGCVATVGGALWVDRYDEDGNVIRDPAYEEAETRKILERVVSELYRDLPIMTEEMRSRKHRFMQGV